MCLHSVPGQDRQIWLVTSVALREIYPAIVCVFSVQMADADESRQDDNNGAKTGDGAKQSTSELLIEGSALFAIIPLAEKAPLHGSIRHRLCARQFHAPRILVKYGFENHTSSARYCRVVADNLQSWQGEEHAKATRNACSASTVPDCAHASLLRIQLLIPFSFT